MGPVRNRCHLDRVVARLKERGGDSSQLLSSVGISHRAARVADFLPLEPVLELEESIALELGDPQFGLDLGLSSSPDEMSLLGYLAIQARSPRSAFETLARYFSLHQTASEIRILNEGAVTRLAYDVKPRGLLAYRQDTDCILGIGIKLLRLLGGQPVEVQLPGVGVERPGEYEDRIQSRLSMGRRMAAIVVPRDFMDAALRPNDSALFGILADYARIKIASSEPDPFLATIRRHIIDELESGSPDLSLESTARALHMGARTLQRKLRAAGTSYRQIVDRIRHDLAIDFLRQPSAQASDVALSLGFSELSAFDRAFRRWTRQSPSEFRRQTIRAL
ncbi:MAG: AraC family transcriptional regulator ligand-binding domain-containing protein [Acidobacteriota bacterium]